MRISNGSKWAALSLTILTMAIILSGCGQTVESGTASDHAESRPARRQAIPVGAAESGTASDHAKPLPSVSQAERMQMVIESVDKELGQYRFVFYQNRSPEEGDRRYKAARAEIIRKAVVSLQGKGILGKDVQIPE